MAVRKNKNSKTPSLSANPTNKDLQNEKLSMEEISEKVFNEVNKKELEKSLDKWLKEHKTQNAITMRDLSLLKSIVAEYLDAFIVFGYTLEGERVILQNYEKPRDRDAIIEFLKTIFIKQQQDNFLD
jgi:beta-glucosidase/6-phospho-beta-glucosidase/beta-galactosidase